MASFLRGFALARESSYFKMEQEADIQKHRTRLVTQGRIEDIAGGYLMPRRQQTLKESAKTFEVLSEVLQQQVRLDDPNAASRKSFIRKIRGQLPKLTEAEMLQYRSSLYGVAAIGQIPKMSFGRDRYQVPYRASQNPPPMKWTPQAKEAARRVFFTGVRSLVYGSVIGGVGVMIAVAAIARVLDVSSAEELRERVNSQGPGVAVSMREWLMPLKTRLQGFFGPPADNALREESELQRRLSSRFAPRSSRRLGEPDGESVALESRVDNSGAVSR